MPTSQLATREPRAESAIAGRVAALDWPALETALDRYGCATTGPLLTADECTALAARYPQDAPFRSRVIMARHGFGRGEYKYFAYPLPDLDRIFAHRALSIARRHRQPLERGARHRDALSGRTMPPIWRSATRLGRRGRRRCCCNIGDGDYNCLHQDLYGEHVFPLQATVLLSRPGVDFTGGEFVLTEQRPRMQSRAEVVPLVQGEAVIFPVHHRPVQRHARRLPGQHAPRRQPAARRTAPHARPDLSRREVGQRKSNYTKRHKCCSSCAGLTRASIVENESRFRTGIAGHSPPTTVGITATPRARACEPANPICPART